MTKSTKKWTLVAVIGLAAAGLIAFFALKGVRTDEIVIGTVLPLTGEYAQYGTGPRKAIDLAVEQRLKAGYPKKIRVVHQDDQMKPAQGRTAITQLISLHKPPVIIGAAGSNVTEVIGPIAQDHRVVLISPASTAAKLSEIGDFFFRTIPADTYEGAFMARFVHKKGVRKVALFAVNDAGTKSLMESFKKEFESIGGKVSETVLAPRNVNDLRTQITSLRASEPEAVFLVGYAQETGVFLKQAAELKFKVPMYSAHPAEAPEVRQIAGPAADGIIFSTSAAPGQTEASRKFIAAYKERYGEEPGEFAAEAYDATMLALDAIAEVGPDAAKVRDYLHRVKDYQGASGKITFLPTGDVEKPMRIMTISAGKLVPLEDTKGGKS